MQMPSVVETAEGKPRRIGVELEFGGIGLQDAAETVTLLFGGKIDWENPHRARIRGTRFGTFTAELDSDYVHPSEPPDNNPTVWDRSARLVREAVGDVIQAWMPREIVTPPLPLRDLPEVDRLCAALSERGAVGTEDGLLYAFALQLNPELPRLDPAEVLETMRAFVLLSPWLYAAAARDQTRNLLSFAAPYPTDYTRKILDPAYAPDWPDLMEDYHRANPDRNRGLDLYPLFAYVDAGRIKTALHDPLIRARPTYHYRVPDCRIDDPDWSVVLEWNRWVKVEALAADPGALAERRQRYLQSFIDLPPEAWAHDTAVWIAR